MMLKERGDRDAMIRDHVSMVDAAKMMSRAVGLGDIFGTEAISAEPATEHHRESELYGPHLEVHQLGEVWVGQPNAAS